MNSLHDPLAVDLSSDILNPFANGHPSAHSDASSSSHIPPSLSQLLTADVDPTTSLSSLAPMQISPQNSDNSPMDVPASSGRAPAPDLLQDFPPPNIAFASDPALEILDSVRATDSSPSTTSAVSSGSHVSSPPLNSLSSAYNVGTSSLASALDDMGPNRTRSNSSASPGNFMPELPLPQDPGVQFPPTDLDLNHLPASDQTSPKNLRVVDNMLQKVQQTVHSAREACSMGQRDQANMRIDELSRIVQAVADLIASTMIIDGPSTPPKSASGNGVMSITSTSFLPPDYPPPGTEPMDFDNILDSGDSSRKRCASSLAVGERVIKVPKLEPQDDPPLLISPPANSASLQNIPASFMFSTSQMSVPDIKPGSLPPSTPGSRPPSSSGVLAMQMSSSANFGPSSLPLSAAGPLDMNGLPSVPHISSAPYPSSVGAAGWTDTRGSFTTRPQHQHTLSGSTVHGLSNLVLSEPLAYPGNGFSPTTPTSHSHVPLIPSVMPVSMATSPPRQQHVVRPSRSSSLSNVYMPSTFSVGEPRNSAGISAPQSPIPSSPEYDNDAEDSEGGEDYSHSPPLTTILKSGATKKASSEGSGSRPKNGRRTSTADANEIPQEFRADVDRIFFEFLGSICSNLDATDAKGEAIHQTLMAKKMQRLDESPDFRPFKFRIQAFTNAFLEELARQGLSDDKIPMKKIRNYLWSQPYISRFNEEGKKTKSKGNHIWHIDAKKAPEGGWMFRPFHRRLAGSPPTVAYVGLRWSWQPRVWDPQGARLSGAVRFSSPSLPSWLSWKDDVLSGTPPADAQTCEVTVHADFTLEGQEEVLSQTIQITIAPMTAIDNSLASARRPSLVGDPNNPRRVQSDSVVPQTAPPTRLVRSQTTSAPAQGTILTPDAQVVQILNEAAERVSQAVQSQVVSSRHPVENSPGLQALAKQQHVLSVSAQAVDNNVSSQINSSTVLMAAAQQVVYHAACQVATTNSVTQPVSSQLSVQDVSAATLSAVAQAVDIVGPLSSEVDVMMTASSLLQQHSRSVAPADSLQIPVISTHNESHSLSMPVGTTSGLFAVSS